MTSFRYTLNDHKLTIDQLLREKWQAGKKTVHLMRMAKSVTNEHGEPIDWHTPLSAGTKLIFSIPDAHSTYVPSSGDLQILYEDDHLIAVKKRADVATHPSQPGQTDTLMNDVIAHIKRQGGTYAEHVHRLDKGTAGVLLIAKHPIAKTLFDRMLEQNAIQRTYQAEVEGLLKRPRGTMRFPIGKDRHHSSKRRVSPSGQFAVTHFTVLERKANSTLVEARLETGRTHQIRVHFAHLGHPIIGDTLYGGPETPDGLYCLTATSVTFTHPFLEKEIIIK